MRAPRVPRRFGGGRRVAQRVYLRNLPWVSLCLVTLSTTICEYLVRWQLHTLESFGAFLPEGDVADVAVVLGYTLNRDGTPTGVLEQRISAGVDLYDQKMAKQLVFSGGHPGGGVRGMTEAAAMLRYAEGISSRGRSDDDWLKEEASVSTRTNAVFSMELPERERWRSVVVVTSAFHQLRSFYTFRCAVRQGWPEKEGRPQVWVVRVPPDYKGVLARLWRQWDVYRDVAGLAYYGARGWLC